MDHRILEGFHDIVATLEDHLKPLVDAELSVLVDILYRPELLFPPNTEARQKCEDGGFISRCVLSTECSCLRRVTVILKVEFPCVDLLTIMCFDNM